MKITAVIFDMDGLMLDTEPLYKAAWQRAATELGFDLDDLSYSAFVGRSTGDSELELLELLGPAFPLPRFRARWPELWRLSAQTQGIAVKAGLLNLLSFIEEQGLARAIATSSDADYAEFSLRSAGLAGRFNTVVTGDQVAQGKPAPDIYLEAARRLGRSPTECVVLEDSDAGVLAASAAGMVTLCVPDLKRPSDEATRAASGVLGSLDDACEWIRSAIAPGRAAGRVMLIRRAEQADANAVAQVFAESKRTLAFLPTVPTVDEARTFLARRIERGEVYVADEAGEIVGFIALSDAMLDHLYVHPNADGRGAGSALFDKAKQLRPNGFTLWVFQKNEKARRFYEHRGCRLLKLTDGIGNMEREPDALYEWRSDLSTV